MTSFKLKLADRVISVECLYESTKKFCKDYLADNESESFSVKVEQADIDAEREKSDRERELEGLEPFVPSDPYLETLALYRKIADNLIDFNVILFHGSSLAMDGRGYIFTAKSGTGKSTHTRLWREVFGDSVVMINDDKPLIKVENGSATVYGTPWCGKHGLGNNISAPLRAVISLERGKENLIKKADPRSVFPKLLKQTYRTKNPIRLQKTLMLLDDLSRSVGLFELECNMDPEAARVAFEGMKGN